MVFPRCLSVLLRKSFTLTLVASFPLLVWTKVKEEERRKKWTDWRQMSELKSIELVDGLHVGDKGGRIKGDLFVA